ncbi:hypothetical protein GCM10007103_30930 [Salinimicrobium marinum]|uniref:Tyr recombinase domain-containing protein n=1 Tax=Salinimicrobium marinum TaxID=680283 RepID=A0A918SK22_9FLAO|nr:site-specific integrase [Salinimicrobium marinum]GHA47816.1 hypothetical protein GCM10007103_30930 [Salinimicrobium marinum]
MKRQKTGKSISVPILPVAQKILDSYSGTLDGYNVLPSKTNAHFNAYLKEIANLCELKINLTHHIARKTFATTVTLSKGVPIESVGKMLGHRSLKTTQIYAKVIDEKVARDMEMLEQQQKSLQTRKK